LLVGIKYPPRDLMCDVISRCAGSYDVGKISVNDKISVEKLKKKIRWVWRNFYTKFNLEVVSEWISLTTKATDARRKSWEQENFMIHKEALWVWRRVKLKFHLARLNSTRLDSTHSMCRAHAFWLCRASRTAQLDSLDTTCSTGSTGSTRRARLARLARHVELDWLDWLDTSSSTGATCNLVMITVIHLLFNKLFTD